MAQPTKPNVFPTLRYQDGPAALDWLAKAFGSGLPNADLTGPDVETGQPFDAKTASRR